MILASLIVSLALLVTNCHEFWKAGPKGLSLLLLEKGMEGLSCKKMKCTGSWASGTTYINFEDVKVPRSNILGEENKGFKLMMFNLNHERWYVAALACRNARTCLEEAVLYAQKRKTFGKKLIEHQAIRHLKSSPATAIPYLITRPQILTLS